MHLVEQYALACGAKIDKPYIYEKFAPLPFNNYITFSPFSSTFICLLISKLIAFSKPIINPKYPTPRTKIIIEPINKLTKLFK